MKGFWCYCDVTRKLLWGREIHREIHRKCWEIIYYTWLHVLPICTYISAPATLLSQSFHHFVWYERIKNNDRKEASFFTDMNSNIRREKKFNVLLFIVAFIESTVSHVLRFMIPSHCPMKLIVLAVRSRIMHTLRDYVYEFWITPIVNQWLEDNHIRVII